MIRALIEAGYIEGTVVYDEDGYPEETDYDSKEANKFIQGLIAQMCLG